MEATALILKRFLFPCVIRRANGNYIQVQNTLSLKCIWLFKIAAGACKHEIERESKTDLS